MKLRFTTIEPLFKTSALISRHRDDCMGFDLTLRVFDRLSLFGFGLASEEAFDFLVGNRVEVDGTGRLRLHRHWRGFRDSGRAAEMAGNQGSDLADGARSHQTGWRQGHADRCFKGGFNFDSH